MIDRELHACERRRELSYVSGRFMTEHLIRVHQLFEGDLTAAVVLATVAQHSVQRYYDEVARHSTAGLRFGSLPTARTWTTCDPAMRSR